MTTRWQWKKSFDLSIRFKCRAFDLTVGHSPEIIWSKIIILMSSASMQNQVRLTRHL